MLKRRPVTVMIFALAAALSLAACGAAPQSPGAQATAVAPAVDAVATAAPALLATVSPAVGDPTVVAQAATSVAEAAGTATVVAGTAVVAGATAVAAAPTALGGSGGIVPQATIDAIIADLAGRLGALPTSISLVSAEAVSWPDGSLGCPQPGMMYPQVLTEGFRVVVAVDGKEYAYHGDDRGQFNYCENPAR